MKEKFENYCKALERLKEALAVEAKGLNIDGTIQRFEFTYELAWKVLQKALSHKGIICNSPRDCFKGAFRMGYITDEGAWVDMVRDRNYTTHIYDEAHAKKIYEHIKNIYFQQFEILKEKLADLV